MIHLILARAHYQHAQAHGILFFTLDELGEILWALLFWRRPSQALYYAGLILVGGLVILWAITRMVPGPFEHEPSAIDLGGLACKASELAGILALTVLAVQGEVAGTTHRPASRVALEAIALAIIGGMAFFIVGRAAEPLLPSLASTGEHAESETAPGHEMEGDHQAVPSGEAVTMIGTLTIAGIWSRPSNAGANGVIYLSITNTGHNADRLVGAQSEAATITELQQSKVEGDVMKMEPVLGGLELPSGATVKLEPGSYHLMLINLQQDLKPGEHYQATLQFEKAGQVTIEVAQP